MERKQKRIIMPGGKEVMSTHQVFFPRPVVLTLNDEIALADGTVRPILRIDGLDDGLLGTPYYAQVMLG